MNNLIRSKVNTQYCTMRRIRRHQKHPQRKVVGDPTLPNENVVVQMRNGKTRQFHFWRDLRPPFQVLQVTKRTEAGGTLHPDGEVHEVVYECGIDYYGERLWNTKSDAGTFDNRIHSTAVVRIPDNFPAKRPLTLLSWGTPALNWSPADDRDDDGNPSKPVMIDPSRWMPISDELKQRADLPRFAACRQATKRADSKKGTEVKPIQKLLLGPHASLAKLAKCAEMGLDSDLTPRAKEAKALRLLEEKGEFPPKKVKMRQNCIFTSAAGFVRYAG